MKIVQINAVFGVGSTGRIVEDIHEELQKCGNDSYVFWAIKCNNNNDNRVIRIGNKVDHKIHALLKRIDLKQGWHSTIQTHILCRKLERLKPDVIHLHNLHSNFIHIGILLSFACRKRIPVLITLHDCWYFTGYCMHYYRYSCEKWKNGCIECPAGRFTVKRIAKQYWYKKAHLFGSLDIFGVNGVSEWTTKDVKDSILKTAKIIRCIYNWIDTEIFFPCGSRDEVFEKYQLDKSKKLVIGVSQGWSREKGLKEMLSIHEALAESVYVGFIGECDQVPSLPGIIKFGYISEKNELAKIYTAADAFINPSRMETFGLVTAEAMACGTPVVGYDNTGTKEIVTKKCGRLVEDGNIEEMIAAVKHVLYQGKQMYSVECVNRITSCFNKTVQLDKYIQLYSDLISLSRKCRDD